MTTYENHSSEMFIGNDIPLHVKMYRFARLASLFKKSNGIFHKQKLYYVSKCSIIGTLMLIILLLLYIPHKWNEYGNIVSIE